jgi:curved DNA-binding protein CbpA
MSSLDYYEILGLTPEADGTTVNRTYWHLARKYQALAVSDPRAHHMLDELNEAYAVLGTSRLRDEYDASPRESDGSAAPSGGSNLPAGKTARPVVRARTTGAAPKPGAPKIGAGASPWVLYAAAGSIAAAAAIAGGLSGNVLLITLGASGGLALAIAATRHKISAAWLKLRASGEEDGDAAPSLAPLKAHRATTAATLRPQRSQAPVDELQESTASMVGRWRSSVARPEVPARQPDSTLVDIFQSERDVETHAEPLSAVLDILRGDHRTVESR